jgi:hypothetical protein
MNKSSAQDQTPGGFEGRAGGSKGNPTPTAKSTALQFCGIAQSVELRTVNAEVPGSIPGPTATVPYLMDVHGLSLAEAYLLAQRNHEAAE